ncbi:MAG: CehA/McbA family metallohydrolase, partial [Acidobacteriota bacterium]
RPLAAGDQVTIVYGAGPVGAVADRFAESESRFWIAVDGDGDGVRAVLTESPAVDVEPGPAARLWLTWPSTVRPGETVRLTAAILDTRGNAGVPFVGEVHLQAPAGVQAPQTITLREGDDGRRTIEVTVGGPGVYRIQASASETLEGESNPLQVTEQGQRILWGDLQNHSNVSDGTATPEEHFLYARDVAALDVMALTDHDHWGLLFLDQHPELWAANRELVRRFHQPGRFVALLGYEWTSWVHGHRHVLFFGDDGPLLSTLDPATDEPRELWAALRGHRALTIAHHSAGGPVATDWSIPPDPEIEPVTEIVSVHGSSEAADSPSVIHQPVAGNFVRDALGRGYRFGFLGSSDGHDGHPGLGHLASPTGGLAAILADELTREAVYQALRARRVYATSGPRILLRVSFGGHPMGSEIALGAAGTEGPAAPLGPDTLIVRAIAPAPLSRVDVIRSGQVVEAYDCQGERECAFGADFPDLTAGEYLYVRAVQGDGGAAWSSPFYFVVAEKP